MEIIAVKVSVGVISTGETIFQANVSKLRKPWGTVDLEELLDSHERVGAPVLWLSCEGQVNVWELFSDNSNLSAILDRQGLLVAAPVDLRTKKAESFWPQLTQGFCFDVAKTSNSWRKTLPYVGTRIRKDLVVQNGAISPEKVPLPIDPHAWRKTQVDFSQSRKSFASTELIPASRERVVPTE